MANRLLENNVVLQYPLNLGSDTIDQHGNPAEYMMFKIYDTEESTKLKGDEGVGPVYVAGRDGTGIQSFSQVRNWSKRQINEYTGTNLNTVEKDNDPMYNVKYDSVDREYEDWRLQKGMTRLNKVVILPMPNEHTVGTSIDYDSKFIPPMLTKLGDMTNAIGDGLAGELVTKGKNALLATLASKISAGFLGDKETLKRSLMAEDRLAENPRKEVMFNDFGFRQFSFRYQFAPKSAEESQMVHDIIQTFRFYALPEISNAKFFYLFPAEFDVAFIRGDKDNPRIPKLTRCVLQRVGVNYAPNSGGWATLPDGSPVAIDLTLDFLEVELVDRKKIYNSKSAIQSGH